MAGSRQVSKRVGQKGRQWRRSLSSTYRATSGGRGNGSLRKTVERLSSSISRRENLPDRNSYIRLVASASCCLTTQRTLSRFRLVGEKSSLSSKYSAGIFRSIGWFRQTCNI